MANASPAKHTGRNSSDLHQLVAELVSDPNFIRLQRLEDQPNLFSAVGQTFKERWHTAFLGWLLDPQGSHGLAEFPLLQFLVGLVGSALPPTDGQHACATPQELAEIATSLDLSGATVLPNERNGAEKVLGDFGRIDVFVDLTSEDEVDERPSRFITLIEVKVKASTANSQEQRYPDWLEARKAEAVGDPEAPSVQGVCVFLCPTDQLGDTSEETVGDPRWYAVDFQFLHDRVLMPCVENPDLSPTMRPLLEHYILNLRSAVKGEKLAVTTEEADLARRICAKHSKTFRLLAETLKNDEERADEVADLEVLAGQDQNEGTPLRVAVDGGDVIEGATVRSFFIAALTYLDDRGLLKNLEIPLSTGGNKRWFLNREPVHQGGHAFNRAAKFEPKSNVPGIFVEVNASRSRALKEVKKLVRSAGLKLA